MKTQTAEYIRSNRTTRSGTAVKEVTASGKSKCQVCGQIIAAGEICFEVSKRKYIHRDECPEPTTATTTTTEPEVTVITEPPPPTTTISPAEARVIRGQSPTIQSIAGTQSCAISDCGHTIDGRAIPIANGGFIHAKDNDCNAASRAWEESQRRRA